MSAASHSSDDESDYVLPEQLSNLSAQIDKAPESLALGNKDMQIAALQAAKYVFDLGMSMHSLRCYYSYTWHY